VQAYHRYDQGTLLIIPTNAMCNSINQELHIIDHILTYTQPYRQVVLSYAKAFLERERERELKSSKAQNTHFKQCISWKIGE
jgi:hypothetical protein